MRLTAQDQPGPAGNHRTGTAPATTSTSRSALTYPAPVAVSDPGEQRRRRIAKLVDQWGSVRASDLADQLGVTVKTVQRDLDALAESARLVRVHGGAISRRGSVETPELRIGLFLPTAVFYYDEVAAGAAEAAQQHHTVLITGAYEYSTERELRGLRRIAELGLDGLVATVHYHGSGLTELLRLGLPTVMVERPLINLVAAVGDGHELLDHVATDHAAGTALACDHLQALGHQRIHLLLTDTPTAYGVRRGLQDRDLFPQERQPVEVVQRRLPAPSRDARLVVDELLPQLRRDIRRGEVTAIVAHNSRLAETLFEALRDAGIDIPGQVSLMSYDALPPSPVAEVVTAVQPPRRAVGRMAVEQIVSRLRGHRAGPPSILYLQPTLVDHGSTGPPHRSR